MTKAPHGQLRRPVNQGGTSDSKGELSGLVTLGTQFSLLPNTHCISLSSMANARTVRTLFRASSATAVALATCTQSEGGENHSGAAERLWHSPCRCLSELTAQPLLSAPPS